MPVGGSAAFRRAASTKCIMRAKGYLVIGLLSSMSVIGLACATPAQESRTLRPAPQSQVSEPALSSIRAVPRAMAEARERHAATLLLDGRLLVSGGSSGVARGARRRGKRDNGFDQLRRCLHVFPLDFHYIVTLCSPGCSCPRSNISPIARWIAFNERGETSVGARRERHQSGTSTLPVSRRR